MKHLNGSALGDKIHNHLVGKKIEMVAKDGQWLIIYTNDGHRYRIGWQDDTGPIKGEPYFAGQDFVIQIQGVAMEGTTLL